MASSNHNIAITGFMAAGKTTIGAALARRLGRPFIDLDEAITRNQNTSPKEIIELHGEEYFRQRETKVLATLLTQNSSTVIALGGGTSTVAANRDLFGDAGTVTVWVDAPFELCWARIKAQGDSRPLGSTFEAARKRYEERIESYQSADLKVTTGADETPEEVADRIIVMLDGGFISN